MAFTVTPLPSDAGGNPRSGDRTRRRQHHGVVIFLKTSSWPSGEGLMQQLEFWGNYVCNIPALRDSKRIENIVVCIASMHIKSGKF
jgi:hypothetical protein